MDKSTFKTFSVISKDNTRLNGHYIIPSSSPAAVIYIIHGLGGHSNRFFLTAKLLAKQNYSVIAIDLRGHGHSEGKRGHSSKLENIWQDIDAALKKGNELHTNEIPRVIYGNSMGGTIALSYANQYPELFKGIILTAPWFKLTKPIKKLFLLTLLIFSNIYPKYTISSRIRSSELRSNPEKQKEAREDPLVHKQISARMFKIIHQLGHYLNYSVKIAKTPTLIIHGIKDPVTDFKSSESYYKKNKEHCSILPLENVMHEIHMEIDENPQIMDHMNKWILHTLNN